MSAARRRRRRRRSRNQGCIPTALAQLLLKTLIDGEASGSGLADRLRVPYSLLDAMIQHARIEKLRRSARHERRRHAPATATS